MPLAPLPSPSDQRGWRRKRRGGGGEREGGECVDSQADMFSAEPVAEEAKKEEEEEEEEEKEKEESKTHFIKGPLS